MTTYTLTQAQYDKLLEAVDFHSACLDWLSALKPNSQEPVAYEQFAIKFATGKKLGYKVPPNLPSYIAVRPLYTHPAPISKEDMVKVLEALQSEVNNYEEDDPEDGAPENLYDARRIMQSAIEGMK